MRMMVRSTRAGVLVAAAALVASVVVSCSAESQSVSGSNSIDSAADGSGFPDLAVATSDGGQLDFGTLEGRDVVLWFWAPW